MSYSQPVPWGPVQPSAPGQPPDQGPAIITAQAGSRLEGLLASFAALKAAAEEAASRFEACKEAIKAEATSGRTSADYVVRGQAGLPVLRVQYRAAWRLDTKRLKAELPETYVRYAVQTGRWELREARP